jgi:cellulose synthase operon protein C
VHQSSSTGKSVLLSGTLCRFLRMACLLPLLFLAACGPPEQRAQDYYEKGMRLIADHDDFAARREMWNAIKYKSDKVEAWRALAAINERTGDTQSLFQIRRRIVELDPKDHDSRVKLARMMVSGGAAEAALKMLEVVNDDDTPNAELHVVKALIYVRNKDVAGGLREAERALAIDPKNVDAVTLVASKRTSDRDFDGALKLTDFTPTDPKSDLRLSLQRIQILAAKGDLSKAIDLARVLIEKYPQESTLRPGLVQLLLAQKRYDEVEKELRVIADSDPKDSKAGLDLVRFLGTIKGANAAQAELEARVKAGGDNFDYQMALADLYFVRAKIAEMTELLQGLANDAKTPERKLAAQVRLAEMYVSKSNFTAAEPLIADILQKDRRNAGALRLRAAVRIERGQLDDAIADLREALNDQPKSAELLQLLAVAYERGGKYELADRQYADALKSSGLNPNVGNRYAAYLQRRGEVARAEDVLTELAGRNPQNLDVLSSLAQIRLSRRNWVGALAVADSIERAAGNKGISEQIRAAALAGQNKPEESVAALEAAHAAAPDAVQPIVSLVSAYIQLQKPEKAESMLQEVLKKFPASARLLVLRGQAQLANKKANEAEQSFKLAMEKQPKEQIGYTALSEFYIRQKKYDAADGAIQAGLRELPGELNLRFASAGLQILKGDQDGAIAQYESILKEQPNSLLAINNLVSLILDYRTDKESLDRALSLAESLKSSTVPQFQDTFGWAQYKRGDIGNAVTTLEAAKTKLPNLASVHYHLGMSYKAASQPEKATEQFKTALSLEADGQLKENILAAMK